ncbi:MAG: hypothetical protein CFE23_00910 [Flavobacterium sp. BFFFF1]|uniref:DUF4270 domain-containing protein n=1 Tax=Flavobacterium sp. BFFFF1 TaxID=2015557 RepID=UPI000BD3923B|nr:DUF4270 domain-containing protein [Flavobacterium sp. BFFFF1]OYU82308.1 MAG: hypothetical protein CFE23_00910 [Flavobacterium sp. BFFFF1]
MNYKTLIKSFFALSVTAVFFVSCDKDYNDIGSDVIGEDHFGFEKYTGATVVAYDKATGVVQSNNLEVNPLGIYKNPTFGITKASFVTQLEMDVTNVGVKFGNNVAVDSVFLSIPYFSKKTATATDGSGTYTLDSIYGSGKMDLRVFENGYYLNDLDPTTGFDEAQKFYNDDPNIDNFKKRIDASGNYDLNGRALNDSTAISQNTAFSFSEKEIITTTTEPGEDPVVSRSAPAMRLRLNRFFFKKKLVDASSEKLSNNATFRDYFRGLYFQIEDDASDDGTALAMMNFKKGTVTMAYKEDKIIRNKANTADSTIRVSKKFILNLVGNTISLQQHTDEAAYANALNAANTTLGDERLYVKGGQGSLAVIDLFGPDNDSNGVADELETMRNQNWLINEANLTFYVDRASMKSDEASSVVKPREPERLYLFDLTNKRPLLDFATDGTTNSTLTKLGKVVHDGIIQREDVDGGRGIKYRIRITNHLRNLIKNDSTNVRLGLAVTESINIISNARLKNSITLPIPFTGNATTLDRMPSASIMHPLGTVLWGSAPTVADDKRLKLEIYYTKPN